MKSFWFWSFLLYSNFAIFGWQHWKLFVFTHAWVWIYLCIAPYFHFTTKYTLFCFVVKILLFMRLRIWLAVWINSADACRFAWLRRLCAAADRCRCRQECEEQCARRSLHCWVTFLFCIHSLFCHHSAVCFSVHIVSWIIIFLLKCNMSHVHRMSVCVIFLVIYIDIILSLLSFMFCFRTDALNYSRCLDRDVCMKHDRKRHRWFLYLSISNSIDISLHFSLVLFLFLARYIDISFTLVCFFLCPVDSHLCGHCCSFSLSSLFLSLPLCLFVSFQCISLYSSNFLYVYDTWMCPFRRDFVFLRYVLLFFVCSMVLARFLRCLVVTLCGCVKIDSQSGATALIWAASRGHTDCVRLLIDAGADKDAKASAVRVGRCFSGVPFPLPFLFCYFTPVCSLLSKFCCLSLCE